MKKEGAKKEKVVNESLSEGLGTSGLTLGVTSIVFMGLYGVVLSIVGLVFSRIQQKNNPTKIGKAAWILNSISLALNIVLLVVYYAFILPQLTQMGISLE